MHFVADVLANGRIQVAIVDGPAIAIDVDPIEVDIPVVAQRLDPGMEGPADDHPAVRREQLPLLVDDARVGCALAGEIQGVASDC